jgi:hypothetical protein
LKTTFFTFSVDALAKVALTDFLFTVIVRFSKYYPYLVLIFVNPGRGGQRHPVPACTSQHRTSEALLCLDL